jgi:hypothetical protein
VVIVSDAEGTKLIGETNVAVEAVAGPEVREVDCFPSGGGVGGEALGAGGPPNMMAMTIRPAADAMTARNSRNRTSATPRRALKAGESPAWQYMSTFAKQSLRSSTMPR